jgi:putative transposase
MSFRNYNNEEIYHLYNRGTEKRDVFIDESDYLRFVVSLNTFNDKSNLTKPNRQLNLLPATTPFVEILSFSLMPNHFHIMVRQLIEGGISKLMQRLLNGYTKYFNIKNERSGTLFESKHKSKHVGDESYFQHLSRYIHLNPLDLVQIPWKTEGVCSQKEQSIEFLKMYPWTSAGDYLGMKRYEFINLDLAKSFGINEYEKYLLSYQPS